MKTLRFAFHLLVRDARSGELGVLFAAVLIAVAALSTVGFFTSRMAEAIRIQAAGVLAADLRVESGRPLVEDGGYAVEAQRQGLRVARLVMFPSVVFVGKTGELASVVGASNHYPLRGSLRVAATPYGTAHVAVGLPDRGEVWVDSRLLARLALPVGATLRLGALTLRVTAVLDYRPDQGTGFADLAPTVLMNDADLPATRLLQTGSRATWALLFAGERVQVNVFAAWLKAHKSDAERMIDVGESSEQMKTALERSGRFLNLASIVTLLLAAVAVAMSARRFVVRHLDVVALLKCMGASQRFVLSVTVLELATIGLLAALAGIAVGLVAQSGLAWLARDLLQGVLPPPTLAPAWLGLGTALAILGGFALPPLLELRHVPPARVLRRNLEPPRLRFGIPYIVATATLIALLYVLVGDPRLVGYASGGLAASAVLLYAAGLGLVRATRGLRGGAGVAWRYGLANVARRGRESAVQVVAFGLGLTVLLLLALVRNDLLADWRRTLPVNAPNHFLINIAPADAEPLREFLVGRGVAPPTLAPWVRGRLIAINGQPMRERMPTSDRGRGFAEREQNLSWSREVPVDNRVVAGAWWHDPDPAHPQVSVASDFQEALGLAVGDRLRFDVAGETVDATLTNIRKVRWDGFRPNFFLVFAPGVLDGATGTFMTSVHLDAAQRPALAELVRRFPSVTIFDIEALLAQVRQVMDRAALAVQYVFVFTLLAGLVVLFAAIQATRDERRYESAVLRTLGASRRTVLLGVAAEFVALGLLSGILAATASSVIGWLVATRLFGLKYSFDPLLWVVGLLAGAVVVGVAGTLATRSVVTAPPGATLRGN